MLVDRPIPEDPRADEAREAIRDAAADNRDAAGRETDATNSGVDPLRNAADREADALRGQTGGRDEIARDLERRTGE